MKKRYIILIGFLILYIFTVAEVEYTANKGRLLDNPNAPFRCLTFDGFEECSFWPHILLNWIIFPIFAFIFSPLAIVVAGTSGDMPICYYLISIWYILLVIYGIRFVKEKRRESPHSIYNRRSLYVFATAVLFLFITIFFGSMIFMLAGIGGIILFLMLGVGCIYFILNKK